MRGAVLFIALIVLVAMTLAGIAMMRSWTPRHLIAGNLAFKQGTMQSADSGIEQAFQWLLANRPTLWSSNPGQGYNSGYATPVWTSPATWTSAVTVGTDAAGNTISYQIHRLCNCADTTYNGTSASCPAPGNQCALDNPTGTGAPPPPAAGDSFTVELPDTCRIPASITVSPCARRVRATP